MTKYRIEKAVIPVAVAGSRPRLWPGDELDRSRSYKSRWTEQNEIIPDSDEDDFFFIFIWPPWNSGPVSRCEPLFEAS